MSTLVIVPCGRSKIWDRAPQHGGVPAGEAYTGAPFKVNRAYAERFADSWVILSAKYGFVRPDFVIPGPYDVTFKHPGADPINGSSLRRQVEGLGLDRFAHVIGLGGKEYRAIIGDAFSDTSAELHFPFAGLPIGRAMSATKSAISSGDPRIAVPPPSAPADPRPADGQRGQQQPAPGRGGDEGRLAEDAFYVYENWQAGPRKAVVHLGSCRYCNRGRGRAGGYDPRHAVWHGPFRSLGEARAAARIIEGVKELKECSRCLRLATGRPG